MEQPKSTAIVVSWCWEEGRFIWHLNPLAFVDVPEPVRIREDLEEWCMNHEREVLIVADVQKIKGPKGRQFTVDEALMVLRNCQKQRKKVSVDAMSIP